MSKGNLTILSIFIMTVIAAGIWYVYNNNAYTSTRVLSLIPNDAALIAEIDNPGKLYNDILNDSKVWSKLKEINSISAMDQAIKELDDNISSYQSLNELLWNSEITIAFFTNDRNNLESAVFCKFDGSLSMSRIREIIESGIARDRGVIDMPSLANSLKVVNTETGIADYITKINSVLIYTQSVDLLHRILENSNEEHVIYSDTVFMNLKRTGGAKAHARVYLNYRKLSSLTKDILNDTSYTNLLWLDHFAGWTELDLMVKSKEVLLSGFTSFDKDDYLGSFVDQDPVKVQVYNIMPYNTNQLLWMGISDFKSYFIKNEYTKQHQDLSGKLNYDISKLINLLTGEISMASNGTGPGLLTETTWIAASVDDVKNAKSILNQIAGNVGYKSSTRYKDYNIGRINYNSFLSELFGETFARISKNYFTSIGSFIVFANSEILLKNLIDYFETGKTLDLNDNFKNFSDNLSTNANIMVYLKPDELMQQTDLYLNTLTSRSLNIENKTISSFKGLSIQLTAGKPYFFTNVYTSYSEAHHEESLALWKVKLHDEVEWGPFLVYDHQVKKENIIIFDRSHNMYLINSEGDILWTKMIDDKPISEIFELDYYRNGKIQYLFNTGDYIYLIDKMGNNVTGFPKKLHSKATNGLVVYDYLNNKDYRILLAKSDKRIYNYDKQGNEIQGWNKPKMNNIVVSPVSRVVANGKDYLIIDDIGEEVKIVDRKGNRRIRVSGNINKARNSGYYVNKTNSKGIIITTDKEGKLVYISSSGKLSRTDFGDFSPDHFFLYEDFNGDRVEDFIYIDNGKLMVFNRFKEVLFEYDFGVQISIIPQMFKLDRKRQLLGVTDDNSRTIYLFDERGNIVISKGLIGETQFTVGDLKNRGNISLISAAGNTLYNYRIK